MSNLKTTEKDNPIPVTLMQWPIEYLRNTPAVNSVAEAIMAHSPGLAGIKKSEGEAPAVAVLVKIINQSVKFFSVGKSMNDEQLIETAKLILHEFYFLKIADLKLFFNRLKTGYYGGLFDRLDGNVIMVHLRSYCNERITTAETLSLEKHKELMALDSEERYIIGVNENYVAHHPAEGFFETTEVDVARLFTYSDALIVRKWLIEDTFSHSPDSVKIKRPYKGMGLISYLQQYRPDLVPPDIKRREKVIQTLQQIRIIEDDNTLTAFQKYNAKATLCGFAPVAEEQFLEEERLRSGVGGER